MANTSLVVLSALTSLSHVTTLAVAVVNVEDEEAVSEAAVEVVEMEAAVDEVAAEADLVAEAVHEEAVVEDSTPTERPSLPARR